jgi:hypothetical protein
MVMPIGHGAIKYELRSRKPSKCQHHIHLSGWGPESQHIRRRDSAEWLAVMSWLQSSRQEKSVTKEDTSCCICCITRRTINHHDMRYVSAWPALAKKGNAKQTTKASWNVRTTMATAASSQSASLEQSYQRDRHPAQQRQEHLFLHSTQVKSVGNG